MALVIYRFRLSTPGASLEQINTEIGTTAVVYDSAGGVLVDLQCDDAFGQNLIDSLQGRGYEFVEGDPAISPEDQFRIDNNLASSVSLANIMQLLISVDNFPLLGTDSTLRSMIWGGTDNWGEVEEILALTYQTGTGGKTHAIRVYDVTNANTIAEATGLSHLTPTIVDLGTVSNLSADPAIWAVQVRSGSPASHRLYFDSISFKGGA